MDLNSISCPTFGRASKQKQVALKTGDRVLVDGQWPGFVRYIGNLDGSYISSDVFIGIKLDDPVGEHDGILDGKRYFRCPDKHGVIVPRKRVSLVLSREAKHAVLYCIVLNYYTGTPLSPVDYFPGSPVKVTYTHTHTHTHNQEIS